MRDPLPAETWKKEVWKDGIGNIDGILGGGGMKEMMDKMENQESQVAGNGRKGDGLI